MIHKITMIIFMLEVLYISTANNLYSINTKARYIITNNIYFGADNSDIVSNSATNTVSSNFGGTFISSLPDISYGLAGTTVYLSNIFYNSGNHEDRFQLFVTFTNEEGDTGSAWNMEFQKSGVTVTIATLDYEGNFTNRLAITIPADAQPGSSKKIVIGFKSLTASSLLTNYTGDNSTNYGGDFGDGPDGPGFINPMSSKTSIIVVKSSSGGIIRYVSHDTNNPVAPYISPSTAATQISDALSVATNGDIIYIIDSYSSYTNFTVQNFSNISISAPSNYSPVVNGGGISIYIVNSSNISLSNLEVKNSGNQGVLVDNSCNISIVNFLVHNTTEEGIKIGNGCKDINIFDNTVKKGQKQGLYIGTYNTNCVIKNNIVCSNDSGGSLVSGIIFNAYSFNTVISNNNVFNNENWNVEIYDAKNLKFVKNEIYGALNRDGVYIDHYNTNIIVRDNNIYDNYRSGIFFAVQVTSLTMVNNTVYSNKNQDGIISEAVLNSVFASNIVFGNYRHGLAEYSGDFKNNLLKNNIIFKNSISGGWGCAIYYKDMKECVVRNNTIFSNKSEGVRLTGNCLDNDFRNNIIVWNGLGGAGYGMNVDGSGMVTNVNYNDVYGNRTSPTNSNTTVGQGNYNGTLTVKASNISPSKDPLFLTTDYSLANFVELNMSSPCINKGDPNDTVPPGGGGRIDIGAKEYMFAAILTVSKSIDTITLGGNSTNAIPGSTITYKIDYISSGNQPASNIIISDILQGVVSYKAGSLKRANTGVSYASADGLSDAQNDSDDASYSADVINFSISNGNAPGTGGTIGSNSQGVCYLQVYVNNVVSGSVLTNVCSVTGNNFPSDDGNITETVSAYYGGSFNSISDQSGSVGTNYINVTLQNDGNTATTYNLSITNVATSYGSDFSKWDIKIIEQNSTTVLNSVTLNMNATTNFRIMIVSQSDVTNNAWVDFRIKADTGHPNACHYTGDDGVAYGGDIGKDWTGADNSGYYGKIFQQGNSEIRFTAQKAELTISKSANVSNAQPGDIVTYKISIANNSSVNASSVKIVDTIPDGTTYVSSSLKQGATNVSYAGATALSDITGDDEGCISGNQITFCLSGGTASNTGGTLNAGSSIAGFFQVMINTNTTGENFTNIVYSTNNISGFDGYILANGDINTNDSLWIGDTVLSNGVTNIWQSADNRDHTIELYSGSGGGGGTNKVSLSPSMITQEDGGGDAGALVDEQAAAGDPPSGACSTVWDPNWPDAPHHAYIDLGSTKHIVLIYLYDVGGTGVVTLYSGSPGSWTFITNYDNSGWQVWKKFNVDINTRYIRFVGTNHDATAGDAEICLYEAGSSSDEYAAKDNNYLRVGNISGGTDTRSFLTFSLADINSNCNVTSATLFLKFESISGTPTVYVDQVVYSNVFDTTSDLTNRYKCDVAPRNVQESNFANFNSSSLTVGDFYGIECSSQVSWSMNNLMSWSDNGSKRVFQVRLRDNDGAVDEDKYVRFYSQNNATVGNRPYLRVHFAGTNIATNMEVRAFTGFDLSKITSGGSSISITAATLFMNCYQIDGNAADIQPLLIDHVDYGSSLNSSDYNGCTVLSSSFTDFNPTSSGWQKFNVLDGVNYAYTHPKSWTKDGSDKWFQVRLRPTNISEDNQNDRQLIRSSDEAGKPYIEITYVTNNGTSAPGSVTNVSTVNGNNFDSVSDTNIINIISSAEISISKSISNIQLNGSSSKPIPGATIMYKIVYSNLSSIAGENVIIYDKILDKVTYYTDVLGTATGWTLEYSTNQNPSQLWNSGDYTNGVPIPKSDIKWIRWRKAVVSSDEDGKTLKYKVVIK